MFNIAVVSNLSQERFILPVNGRSAIRFAQRLSERISEQGGECYLLPRSEEYLPEIYSGIDEDVVITDHFTHTPTQDFETLLDKYDIESARSFVFPQMVYNHDYPKPSGGRFFPEGPDTPEYEPYFDKLHRLLDFFDEIYTNGFDAIPIQHEGAEINRRVLEVVSSQTYKKSIRYSFSPLPGRLNIRRGESMSFPLLKETLDEELSADEKERAEEYRKTVTGQKPEIGKSSGSNTNLLYKLSSLINSLSHRGTDIFPYLPKYARQKINKPVHAKLQKYWYQDIEQTQEMIKNEPFLFYPIQYYRESRVTMRSPAFYDQASLIRHLSRCVPTSQNLYVKDHPQQVGAMKTSDIRSISKFSKLVDADFSSHKLISESEAVISLNNTVGHEAIIWGKPVIPLGEAFYDAPAFVYSVDDLNEMNSAITQAIKKGGPSPKEVLRYIEGLYRMSSPGIWGDQNQKNVDDFLTSIETTLQRG